MTTQPAGTTRAVPATGRARARVFRTDIQALRALAIAAVVLNHLWPGRAPGGYIGVDVFFVISGFLITSHLHREVARTGRLRLGEFYARRIRRLLPAAFVVLAVSAVLVWVFLPYPRWERSGWEIAASAVYAQNWLLAALSVDYSALNDAATVAQHYWSLSVEEQFYLVWPLLIVLAVAGGRRSGRLGVRRSILAALAVIFVLSLASSVWMTIVAPSEAYFVTYARAWEFAAGGMTAVVAHRLILSKGWADVVSAAGFAAIIAAIVLFDTDTPFPGAAALLPVLGTVAIIVAGDSHRLWHTPFTASRPVQWLGDVSYSLYLWHWPLIVVAPFVLGGAPSALEKLIVLALALVLAWITKVTVEDPGQRWRLWKTSVARSVSGMLVGMTVIALGAVLLVGGAAARSAGESPFAGVQAGDCAGPNALSDAACADPFGPPRSAVMSARNEYFASPDECGDLDARLSYGETKTTRDCDFSQGADDAPRVWLVGDSHAQQWQGAVFDIAREHGWHLTLSYLGGCPAADVPVIGFRTAWPQEQIDTCRQWAADLSATITADAPDLVVTSMAARLHLLEDVPGSPAEQQYVDGLTRTWSSWVASGTRVAVIADPPLNGEVRAPDCVLYNEDDPVACAVERGQAQPADPMTAAVAEMDDPSVVAVDLTDRFCDAERCYAVVGGEPVYYDADHLNLQYVRMLAPLIAERIDAPTVGRD